MKLAILFYGRINKFKSTYDSFINAIGNNEMDIFYSCDSEDPTLLSEFNDLYKPIAVCNEKIHYSVNFSSYPGKEPCTNIHNMTCQFINKQRVFRLFKEHIEKTNATYDNILSTRLDLLYISSIPLCIPEENAIYLPEQYDAWHRTVYNDQLAFGNMDTMDIYMNIFNMAELYLNQGRCIPHPEFLNEANIVYHGLKLVQLPIETSILR